MPRSLRMDHEGAFHHVMNRGAAHREVFSTDRHCVLFLELLQAACDKHELRIHAYCLMGNHFHLLAESEAGRLSAAMRDITGKFTRIVNGWIGTDGPLFRGRFKSVEVSGDRQFLSVSRYIHLNPVAARLSPTAIDWRWSSAGAFAGRSLELPALVIEDTLALFEPGHDYAEFLADGIDAPTREFYEREKLPRKFRINDARPWWWDEV